ncbi:UNVERIFIED_CONTAM: hypothetical protein GTU68_009331 [Idotea baltica]|nr:hypothetical protein [Idotea baltica]
MRPEISGSLLEKQSFGENLFVSDSNIKEDLNLGNVIWFSGLSGSGKSTIATAFKEKLENDGFSTYILDGDEVRDKRKKKLGFTKKDILTHNGEIIQLAKEYQKTYDYILIPVITPYEEIRTLARKEIGEKFKLIYVNTSIEECSKRDTKGLYAKAKAGEINNLIGFSSSNPYEKPTNPDLVLKTEKRKVEQSVGELYEKLS